MLRIPIFRPRRPQPNAVPPSPKRNSLDRVASAPSHPRSSGCGRHLRTLAPALVGLRPRPQLCWPTPWQRSTTLSSAMVASSVVARSSQLRKGLYRRAPVRPKFNPR